MLAIKLQRIGKKHQPAYRLVVQEKRTKLGGRYVENIGWYNPMLKKYEFKKDRVQHWLKIGAKATDTVHNLLVTAGIVQASKIPVHKKSKKQKAEKPVEAAASAVQPAAAEEPAS